MRNVERLARTRAGRSRTPVKFMRIFEETLKNAVRGNDMLRDPLDFTDPVRVAAEVEALTAAHTLAARTHAHSCCCCEGCRVRRYEQAVFEAYTLSALRENAAAAR